MDFEQVAKKVKKKKENLVKKISIEDDDEAGQAAYLAQRRAVRSAQNAIQDKMDNLTEQLLDITNNDTFDGIRNLINNETFKEITHVREACKDAEIMKDLSGIVLKRARKLDDSSKRYNFTAFMGRLKELFSTAATADDEGDESEEEEDDDEEAEEEGGKRARKRRRPKTTGRSNNNSLLQLNWTRLGADAGQLFYGATPINTLKGPLGAPPKAKKVIVRQERSNTHAMIAAKPKEVVNDKEDGVSDDEEEGEATRARIKNLGQTLLKMNESAISLVGSNQKHKTNKLPFFDVFVDPKDNVQTIENIFDLAFLMKTADVIVSSEDGIPFVVCDKQTSSKILGEANRQQVLSINMKELQELQKMHDGTFDPDATVALQNILENMNEDDEDAGDDENTPSKNKKKGKSNSSPSQSQKKRQSISASACVLHRDDELYLEKDVHRQAEIIQEMDEKRMKEKTALRKERKRKERLASQSDSSPKVARV